MPEDGYWYGIDGVRHGPVSFAQIRDLVRRGRLRPTDYIWNEQHQVWTRVMDFPGLENALPSGDVDAVGPTTTGGPGPTRPAGGGTDDGAEPSGGGLPREPAEEPGGPPAWMTQDLSGEEDLPPEAEEIEYAGFWIRVGAYFIDSLVLGFFTMIWFFIAAQMGLFDQLLALERQAEPDFRQLWESMPLAYYVGSFVIVWFYEALLLSSSWQATVGKRAMGIQVVNREGGRCTFWQASLRTWVKNTISGIFLLGFLLVIIDERRQALHDMIARTFCEKT